MEFAKQMLDSNEYPIEKIALECGFGGLTGFSRKFKQELSTSPSEYRKKILGERPKLCRWEIPFSENYFQQLIQLKKKQMVGKVICYCH